MHALFLKSPIACSLFQSPSKPKLRVSLSAVKDRCSHKVSHNIRIICTLPAGSKESPLLLQCPSLPPAKFLQCVCHVQCGLRDLGSALSSERCWSPSFLKKKGEICHPFSPSDWSASWQQRDGCQSPLHYSAPPSPQLFSMSKQEELRLVSQEHPVPHTGAQGRSTFT